MWTGVTRPGANILSPPAVADGLVFVTNYADRHLYAFPEHCASDCHYRWTAPITPQDVSPPAVANGVVYVSVGSNEKNVGIDAFSVTCATGGRTCTPLWHKKLGFYIPSGPSVAGGMVWVADGPENGPADLYALGLPSGRGPRRTVARGGGGPRRSRKHLWSLALHPHSWNTRRTIRQ